MQTAPFLFNGMRYSLFDVAVKSGSTAIAVGGHPIVSFGLGSAGAIIYTVTGGLTWKQAVRSRPAARSSPAH